MPDVFQEDHHWSESLDVADRPGERPAGLADATGDARLVLATLRVVVGVIHAAEARSEERTALHLAHAVPGSTVFHHSSLKPLMSSKTNGVCITSFIQRIGNLPLSQAHNWRRPTVVAIDN